MKNKKISTLWGIIILLVIGGGVYWYVDNQIKNEKLKQIDINQEEKTKNNFHLTKIDEGNSTSQKQTEKTLDFNQKLDTVLKLTPRLTGANFICNSENNCPNILDAIKTQDYSSCDSLGVYVFDNLEKSHDGRQTIVTKLDQNPNDKNSIKDLEEYKKICKSTIAILKSDTNYELSGSQLAGLYSLNNDVDSCSTLDTYKENCLQNIALIFGNENTCLKTENKDICYKNIAFNTENENYCEEIDNRTYKRACYIEVAVKTNNSSLCNALPYTQEEFNELSSGPIYEFSDITQCYMKVAEELKKPEICEEIDNFDKQLGTILKNCKDFASE